MKAGVILLLMVAMLLVGAFGVGAQTGEEWIPGVASFILPGLGQFLNDEVNKAILHFGVRVAIFGVGFYATIAVPRISFVTGALALGWHVYSGWEAYNVAGQRGFRLSIIDHGIAFRASF